MLHALIVEMTRIKKKGEGENTIYGLVILVILLVVAFYFVNKYIIQPGGALDKQKVEAKCLDFYKTNDLIGFDLSKVNTCTEKDPSKNGCPEDRSLCCDVYPDDKIKLGENNFYGCCLPLDLESKCPKPTVKATRSLSGEPRATTTSTTNK